MKGILHFTLLSVFLFAGIVSDAQSRDTIVTTSNERIPCFVKRVTDSEIEYKKKNAEEAPVYVIARSKVSEIRFADGTKEVFASYGSTKSEDPILPEDLLNQKRSALKLHFFAPLTDQIAVSYERLLRRDLSLEGSLGIINNSMFPFSLSNQGSLYGSRLTQGMTAGAGVKFIVRPSGTRMLSSRSPLHGFYFNPELLFSTFAIRNVEDYYNGPVFTDIIINSLAIQLGVGHQSVVSDIVTFDVPFGMGYAVTGGKFTNTEFETFGYPYYGDPSDDFPFHYNHTQYSYTSVSYSINVRLGILLK